MVHENLEGLCVTGDESWRFRLKKMLHVTFKGVLIPFTLYNLSMSQGLNRDLEALRGRRSGQEIFPSRKCCNFEAKKLSHRNTPSGIQESVLCNLS